MEYKEFDLFPGDKNTNLKAYINHPLPGFQKRKAVLVLPGGGYSNICDEKEGYPIARQYLAAGYNAFMLSYSVAPNASDFKPLVQVALSIKFIRENAEKFGIDPNYVFTVGFSAGGHLSGSAGVFWNHPKVIEAVGSSDTKICRPTGMILCYAVVSSGSKAHVGSFKNLCGNKDAAQEQMDEFSLETHVDGKTPPAFIWHTVGDTCVPVENALFFANALQQNKISYELHIYPGGCHGMSLSTPEVCHGEDTPVQRHVRSWLKLSMEWIELVEPSNEFLI